MDKSVHTTWGCSAWSTRNPGLIVILLDTSVLMFHTIDGASTPLSVKASKVVNRIIDSLIQINYNGDRVTDRCFIQIIGYSDNVQNLKSGFLSDFDRTPLRIGITRKTISDGAGGFVEIDKHEPIWIDPLIEIRERNFNCVFSYAKDSLTTWKTINPGSPAPLIINISSSCENSEVSSLTGDEIKTIEILKGISNLPFQGGESTHIINVLLYNEAKETDVIPSFFKLISSPFPSEYLHNRQTCYAKSHCIYNASEYNHLFTLLEYAIGLGS